MESISVSYAGRVAGNIREKVPVQTMVLSITDENVKLLLDEPDDWASKKADIAWERLTGVVHNMAKLQGITRITIEEVKRMEEHDK